jgi:hypothetical protein
MTTAEAAARALGFRRIAGRWRGRCPACGHETCTLADGRAGLLAWCWHPGCDRGALLERLRELGVLPDRALTPEDRARLAEARRQREQAQSFARAGVLLCELALERMPATDPRREDVIQLLLALERSPEAEAAWFKQNRPEMFEALIAAWARQQKRWRRRAARLLEVL